jgi:uncharacterized protein YciI
MPFLVIGKDYADGLQRRMEHRSAHLENLRRLKEDGKIAVAAGLLNDEKMLNGSATFFTVSTQTEVEELLKSEPYIIGNVWETIEIIPCLIPDFLLK